VQARFIDALRLFEAWAEKSWGSTEPPLGSISEESAADRSFRGAGGAATMLGVPRS